MTALSVVIPKFNRSWGLKRAIVSVLEQTFSDFELIICDDHSSDDTPELIHSFTDPRIQYHRQTTNVGVSKNWGMGLAMACGEFVSLLMDDDRYEPGFLAARVAALRAHPQASFAFGRYRVRDESGRETKLHSPPHHQGEALVGRELVSATLAQDCFVGATLYRTTDLRAVWPEAESAGVAIDYAANIRLAIRPGASAVYVGGIDFVMSEHDGQLSQTKTDEVFSRTLQIYEDALELPILRWTRRLVRRFASQLLVQGGRAAFLRGNRRLAVHRLIRAAGYDPLWRGPWTQIIRVITG